MRAGTFSLRLRCDTDSGLETGLASLSGVGAKTAQRLRERGFGDALQLLTLFPNRYQRTLVDADGEALRSTRPEHVVLRGTVTSVRKPRPRSRQPLEVVITCDDERLVLVWFHVPGTSFADGFRIGRTLEVAGAVDWSRNLPRITHPRTTWVNELSEGPPQLRWEPVYPAMEGVRPAALRAAILQALERYRGQLVEVVPASVRAALDLVTIQEALDALHALDATTPDLLLRWDRARERIVYEELYTLQLALAREQMQIRARLRAPRCADRELGRRIAAGLAFPLTGDQREVLGALAADLERRTPMRRLLQGDVGSGKTIVAQLLGGIAIGSGQQVAMMAPTEVLARQHEQKARALFEPHGVEVVYLGGSVTGAARRDVLQRLRQPEPAFVVGTHALFGDDVEFGALGFVVVDEQHKFGVEQRQRLLDKGSAPHLLAMTATPIPRSLAHAAFGDLEIAVIRERPPGREPVRTYLRDRQSREKLYRWVMDEVVANRQQAYVVFPAIEDDSRGFASLLTGAEDLANGWLRGARVGVLHGQMGAEDKFSIMSRFAAGEIDVLCTTTVVEVGVDVANATVMVIESAEAFGLSQLHQLRGRVGRGAGTSRCVLVAGQPGDDARSRLEVFQRTSDGFELAEMDLLLRGPGEFLGVRQSGAAEFRFADLVRDAALLERAREDARRTVFGDVSNA